MSLYYFGDMLRASDAVLPLKKSAKFHNAPKEIRPGGDMRVPAQLPGVLGVYFSPIIIACRIVGYIAPRTAPLSVLSKPPGVAAALSAGLLQHPFDEMLRALSIGKAEVAGPHADDRRRAGVGSLLFDTGATPQVRSWIEVISALSRAVGPVTTVMAFVGAQFARPAGDNYGRTGRIMGGTETKLREDSRYTGGLATLRDATGRLDRESHSEGNEDKRNARQDKSLHEHDRHSFWHGPRTAEAAPCRATSYGPRKTFMRVLCTQGVTQYCRTIIEYGTLTRHNNASMTDGNGEWRSVYPVLS